MEELACGLFLLSKGGEKGGVMPGLGLRSLTVYRFGVWDGYGSGAVD